MSLVHAAPQVTSKIFICYRTTIVPLLWSLMDEEGASRDVRESGYGPRGTQTGDQDILFAACGVFHDQ